MSVNTEKSGTYFVEYNVSDEAENKADPLQREIFVGSQILDETPPVITLNGDAKMTLHIGELYTELGASASDDRDGVVDVIAVQDLFNAGAAFITSDFEGGAGLGCPRY